MTTGDFFSLNDISLPHILAEEKGFLVVYKPPGMHSAPLPSSAKGGNPATSLADWCAERFPETAALAGRQAGDGGLLHRLDYETHGLLLVARTQAGMDYFLAQQKEGKFLKEYSALATERKTPLPGFPPFQFAPCENHVQKIQSAFRAYGPGRKAVRPVITSDEIASNEIARDAVIYTTGILDARSLPRGITAFHLRIVRGFRHQIRSHLAWLGMPILNDSLYGGASFGGGLSSGGFLSLRACSLLFTDPASGKDRCFSIRPLEVETFLAS